MGSKKETNHSFMLLTKHGIYCLDNVYIEKFLGSYHLVGNGANIKGVTLASGALDEIQSVLDVIKVKIKNNGKNIKIDISDIV